VKPSEKGADVLDPVPFPQPAGPAKGRDAAFGGDAGTGEDDDGAGLGHGATIKGAAREIDPERSMFCGANRKGEAAASPLIGAVELLVNSWPRSLTLSRCGRAAQSSESNCSAPISVTQSGLVAVGGMRPLRSLPQWNTQRSSRIS